MKALLILILLTSVTVIKAQVNKNMAPSVGGGGNGQLVVIPRGHKKPVPYEIAKSFDSGVYRNFYKLPGLKGNTERRARFNKDYALYAVKWLEIIKGYSQGLYEDLTKAARTTRFRYLDNYILWEHQKYPAGEVDYKKYEKAAYYNGEIIVSTIVMDRLGDLKGYLSKEMNQGFVLVHELINAAYPSKSVKEKLDLGEMIANIKLLGWSKDDFLEELYLGGEFSILARESAEAKVALLKKMVEHKEIFRSYWNNFFKYSSFSVWSLSPSYISSFPEADILMDSEVFIKYLKIFQKEKTESLGFQKALKEMKYSIPLFDRFYLMMNLLGFCSEIKTIEEIKNIFLPFIDEMPWSSRKKNSFVDSYFKTLFLGKLIRSFLYHMRDQVILMEIDRFLNLKASDFSLEKPQSLFETLSILRIDKSRSGWSSFHWDFDEFIKDDYLKFSYEYHDESERKKRYGNLVSSSLEKKIINHLKKEIKQFKKNQKIRMIYLGGTSGHGKLVGFKFPNASVDDYTVITRGTKIRFLKKSYSYGECSLDDIGISFDGSYRYLKTTRRKIKLKNTQNGKTIKMDIRTYGKIKNCIAVEFN